MKDFFNLYKNCLLCPRQCGVNRIYRNSESRTGFCGETGTLRVGYIGPHFGEEPPITGEKGSGTIFFSGCSLKCSYCQNHQISHKGMGESISLDDLLQRAEDMARGKGVHNINFVTPDHFFPHTFRLISLLRDKNIHIPIIYNTSGYQSVDILRIAEDFVDIYIPDFKYSDPLLAAKLSRCKDYPHVALETISEMVRQKGFLDTFPNTKDLARKGVLIRHMILPGHVENSLDVLTTLYLEFGVNLPISLMSQYYPVIPQGFQVLNRYVRKEEFDRVYNHALSLGFENMFVQFPEKDTGQRQEVYHFLPDFSQVEPFETHIKK